MQRSPLVVMTQRALNRATLARQLLLEREPLSPVDAVRRLLGLQAQEPASPYLSLWNRVTDLDPTTLDAAIADHSLVKASLLRGTLHLVTGADYPAVHTAMQTSLRASRLGDRRFTGSGLSPAEADAAINDVLAHTATARTAGEIEARLGDRFGELAGPLWFALRTYAPLWRAPTGGPWQFQNRTAYRAARSEHEPDGLGSPEDHRPDVVRRYLAAFGPATVPDIAQFTFLQRWQAHEAVAALGDDLERIQGQGRTVWYDVPGAPRPDPDTPAPPRLLGMWDNALLGYADRSRIIPEAYRRSVIRTNGDCLPTLLVDGYVAGVWRVTEAGVEATAFHPLPDDTWDGLAGEAERLQLLLAGRDDPWRRFHRWWEKLPDGEVRLLAR